MKKRSQARFAITLALAYALLLAVIAAAFACVALDMEEGRRTEYAAMLAEHAALLAALALMLLAALGTGLHALSAAYPRALERLAEDTVLMASRPGHRAPPQGAREVRMVADKANALAGAYRALQQEVQLKIDDASRALAHERNRLAALMAELSLGVLVCNLDGRILLYNERARQVLRPGETGEAGPLGLGRPVSAAIDGNVIEHALERLRHGLNRQEPGAPQPVAGFVITTGAGRMLRARMTAVMGDDAQTMDGFVLTLEDITEELDAGSRRDTLMQTLMQETRSAVANIRAALETMQAFPAMSETKRAQFAAIIDEESARLAWRIRAAEREQAGARWQPEEMRGGDLLDLLARRIASLPLRVDVSTSPEPPVWLKVDSYALARALCWLCQCLARERRVDMVRMGLQRAGRLAYLDIVWDETPPEDPLPAQALRGWECAPLYMGASGSPSSLEEVVRRHDAESLYRFDPAHHLSLYRLLMPAMQPKAEACARTAQRLPRLPSFDFDLFRQPGQNAGLDERPLRQLSYTVFDTETTGLNPAEGDDIIAIGAVRIVNARLLRQETFSQLVRPRHGLSPESIAIHGITDAMLAGQPAIETVLPRFFRFAEDTVLIAHNAAFDMRFLQMQEERTGIRFTQPVLDTLLLSQAIHPHQQEHAFEAIAARLGVEIVDRHTALGDALAAGEMFLSMLPLLEEKGIRTLGQAREASRKTLYADIRY